MLQGQTKEQAFFVRCDRTTMTQADIDNGRLIMIIGIAPVKPAEFVIFRIGQWTGGADVTEAERRGAEPDWKDITWLMENALILTGSSIFWSRSTG